MKIQTSQFVIPAKAGTQAYLWDKTIFYHLYEMLIFLNVFLGSCLRRNDKLWKLKCVYYVELTLLKGHRA